MIPNNRQRAVLAKYAGGAAVCIVLTAVAPMGLDIILAAGGMVACWFGGMRYAGAKS